MLAMTILGGVGAVGGAGPGPDDYAGWATLVSQAIIKRDKWFHFHYGPSLMFDAIFEGQEVLGLSPDLVKPIDDFLDKQISDPTSYAYKALHNITIPWDHDIGDDAGLFPQVYLTRAVYYSKIKKPGYTNTTDIAVAKTLWEKFVRVWPIRTSDNTIARDNGFYDANARFIWADDGYMGIGLPSRLARAARSEGEAREYLDFVVTQLRSIRRYLVVANGSLIHGANAETGEHSCCQWGRANGWPMLAQSDVLVSLAKFPNYDPTAVSALIAQFVAQARALAKLQTSNGLWHQVVNETSTFLETSASAMFVAGIARGVRLGLLSKSEFDGVIRRGWDGIRSTINPDGTINGICQGTGIMKNVAQYNARSTDYEVSGDPGGPGAVLYSILELKRYTSL